MERRWVRLAYSFMAVISAFLVFMIIRMIQYPEWTRVPMILFEIDLLCFSDWESTASGKRSGM